MGRKGAQGVRDESRVRAVESSGFGRRGEERVGQGGRPGGVGTAGSRHCARETRCGCRPLHSQGRCLSLVKRNEKYLVAMWRELRGEDSISERSFLMLESHPLFVIPLVSVVVR